MEKQADYVARSNTEPKLLIGGSCKLHGRFSTMTQRQSQLGNDDLQPRCSSRTSLTGKKLETKL